jgi:hypothetical protein
VESSRAWPPHRPREDALAAAHRPPSVGGDFHRVGALGAARRVCVWWRVLRGGCACVRKRGWDEVGAHPRMLKLLRE